MKAQEHRLDILRRNRFEADLDAGIKAIFRRIPTLCGFSVHEAADALVVTEVSVHPSVCLDAPGEICHEIVTALTELIDECPETAWLLRERTFARVFH